MCLVCLFATVCLPVVAAGSERAGWEPPAGKARFASSANSAQLVCRSPTGSPKMSGPTDSVELLGRQMEDVTNQTETLQNKVTTLEKENTVLHDSM